MKWLKALLATLFLLAAYPVHAQIVRADCDIVALTATAIQACWDNAELKWKYWNGTVWVDATGGAGGAPTTVNYLVGTADAGLSAEIVVGTTPGGELGGTWGSPTVDATHSGSSHASIQAAAEATAQAALDAHTGDATAAHAASAISVDSTNLDGTGTNVQTVLEELENQIAAAGGGDLTEVQVTSPITVTSGTGPIPNIACPTCETTTGAQAKVDVHTGDTSAAHASSAIAFTPHGSIGSTNLQDALQEVRDEAALASDVFTQTEANAVDFIVGTSTANLTGERVCTDTATIDCDMGTGGQAKFNVQANSIGAPHVNEADDFTFTGKMFTTTTVASLGTATAGVFKIITDGLTSGSCAVGGGSVRQLCMGDGSSWLAVSPAGTPGLQAVSDVGRVINNAVDLTTSHRIGNTVIQGAFYCDTSNVCHFKTVDATTGLALTADKLIEVDVGKVLLYADDNSGQTPHKIATSAYVSLTERGAVTIGLESIVSNQPKAHWAIVTDANTDALDFHLPITPKMVGMTTATVRLVGVSKNATPSGNIVFTCAVQAIRPGTDTYVAHSTTGEQTITLTPAVQNRPVAATSPAITINGTVASGGELWGSCEVDATGTTASAAQLLDFRAKASAVVQWSINGLSD